MVRAIKRYRQLKGWSQSRLARESKVSQTYISELEAGKWSPNLSILRKLAAALGVPVSALLEDDVEGSDEDYKQGYKRRGWSTGLLVSKAMADQPDLINLSM